MANTEGKKSFADFFAKNSKYFMFGIIGVAVVAVLAFFGVTYFYKEQKSDVVATIGSEKITTTHLEQYLNEFTDDASYQNLSAEDKRSILKTLAEYYVLKQEASKLGVSVSEEEMKEYFKQLSEQSGDEYPTENFTELQKEAATTAVLRSKISEKVVGYKTGKVALARFDRYYEKFPVDDKTAQNTEVEKAYAKAKIEELYTQFKSGQKTMDQVMAELDNDTKIGKVGWDTDTYDFSFVVDKDTYVNKGVNSGSKDLWNYLNSAPKGTGEITLFHDKKVVANEQEKDYEAFYAFAVVDEVVAGEENYEAWLAKKFSEYQFDVNKYFG